MAPGRPLVAAAGQDAIIVGGPQIEVRPRRFPDQAAILPALEALDRGGRNGVGADERAGRVDELRGLIARGQDHPPGGDVQDTGYKETVNAGGSLCQ